MLNDQELLKIKKFAVEIRRQTLVCIASAGSGHVGGSLSIADLLAVLYSGVMKVDPKNPQWAERDYIVISKGHSGPAMYAALALKGYFPLEMLETLNFGGTNLPSHTDRLKTPGVDMTTGSLGQGASTAVGLALTDKKDHCNRYTYLILGDGECQEGQVWEAALFAAHHKLDNLITFIDANKKQLDGYTEDICSLGSLAEKFNAFGFNAIDVPDGNDACQIYRAIEKAKECKGKPSVIVLNTVKGKGCSCFEEMFDNHSTSVGERELEAAFKDLDSQYERICSEQGK